MPQGRVGVGGATMIRVGGGASQDRVGVGGATMIKFESLGPESAMKLLRDYVEQENLGVKARSKEELYERICEARRSSQGPVGGRTPQARVSVGGATMIRVGGGASQDRVGVGEATMIKFESIGPESGIKLLRDYVEQKNLGVKARSRAELNERVRAVRYRAAQMHASAPRLPPPKAYRREARRARPVH